MLKKFFNSFFVLIFIFSIYANLLVFSNSTNTKSGLTDENNSVFIPDSTNLFWPVPGFHTITSPFGYRISPITKNKSFHYGIDIGALEGSLIYSASKGKVSFLGYDGANGYSIHIIYENLKFIYGHVSPNYIINVGDGVLKGQIIRKCWS